MDSDIEKIIDGLWNSSLARVARKEVPAIRPALGDYIDLMVPQGRLLSLLEANPTLASLIYYAAYSSASRNAYIIMRKLNMPADYFWKYEYWPIDRAFSTLQRVINRVFTAIMSENKEGMLNLQNVDVEKLRFTISFQECAECAGVKADRYLCYYHAGTFAGIIGGLMGKEMDGYEVECTATGQNACVFVIGRREDPEIGVKLTDFLAPKKLGVQIGTRLRKSLCGESPRSLGNLVNIDYYQLMVTNSILNNPALFSASSFNVGVEAGKNFAAVLKEVYRDSQIEIVKNYYHDLRYLELTATEPGADIVVSLSECAEITPTIHRKELFSFLLGELQGLFSGLTGRALVCKESWFEGMVLKVRLSPQV